MKYLIFFIISFALIGLIISLALSNSPPIPKSPPPANKIVNSFDQIDFNNNTFSLTSLHINNPQNLHLFPNFDDQKNSSQLIDQHHCQALINGGFYTKTNQPIGWFVSENQVISPAQTNQLLNGFLWLNQKSATISTNPPQSPPNSGLQSGPLLIHQGQALKLQIRNDEPRRRVLAALTNNEKLYFFTIFTKDSTYEGPYLKDLPQIVQQIETQLNLKFSSAINLDGGTASTFYDGTTHLQEAQPIGSFFCLQ